MKTITLSLICLLSTCFVSAQVRPADCEKFRKGTFKINNGGHVTIVKRFGSTQQEYLDGAKTPTTYVIKWADDCSYTLIPNSDVFKKYPDMPKNITMKVQVTKVVGNACTMVCNISSLPKSITFEMVKIK